MKKKDNRVISPSYLKKCIQLMRAGVKREIV